MMTDSWVNFGKQTVLSQTQLIEPVLCPAQLGHFFAASKTKITH